MPKAMKQTLQRWTRRNGLPQPAYRSKLVKKHGDRPQYESKCWVNDNIYTSTLHHHSRDYVEEEVAKLAYADILKREHEQIDKECENIALRCVIDTMTKEYDAMTGRFDAMEGGEIKRKFIDTLAKVVDSDGKLLTDFMAKVMIPAIEGMTGEAIKDMMQTTIKAFTFDTDTILAALKLMPKCDEEGIASECSTFSDEESTTSDETSSEYYSEND